MANMQEYYLKNFRLDVQSSYEVSHLVTEIREAIHNKDQFSMGFNLYQIDLIDGKVTISSGFIEVEIILSYEEFFHEMSKPVI